MGTFHHVRLQPSPSSSLTTFGSGKPDSTSAVIAAPYVQHTSSLSPRFGEYAGITKADHNLPGSTLTESLQPRRAGAKSHHSRDNSGLSTGALVGVVIGAIVIAAFDLWDLRLEVRAKDATSHRLVPMGTAGCSRCLFPRSDFNLV